MPRKFFRKILVVSTFILAISALSPFNYAKAAPATAAFVLHSYNKDYPISASDLQNWQTASGQGETYVSFSPEQDLNSYVLSELGLQDKASSHLHFEQYNISSIYKTLKAIEAEINIDPADAKMTIQNVDGLDRVTDFNPGINGEDLDVKSSINNIVTALSENKTTANLNITETLPSKTLATTNNLGINELVAYGESNYSGSPKNRIFNIKVGVQKEAGILIKPGEEFSFNKYLGPVDGDHGFLPELVIKGAEGTVPEFGGGLCQVSSTVFRAAMNAGLPITARRNHSYAVSYYAPQGTDATIYPGVQDMKFVNDSPATLLVWPELSDKNILRFYLYGTKDTRQVSFDGPHTFDKQASGAMKAVWTRFITSADGTVKKDVFNSNYQSPALFHKTTTAENPVPTTPPLNTTPITSPPLTPITQ
ncbi:MAG: hypothetical protein JWO40_145 [Candidatus Doudnabacteria bacterium]|nr:hypothetical protein [Candidatus Doudnabacteria bacterium]